MKIDIVGIGFSILLMLNACEEGKKNSFEKCNLNFVAIDSISHEYLFPQEIEEKWAKKDFSAKNQAIATDYSFIGEEEKVSENYYEGRGGAEPLSDSATKAFLQKFKAIPAKEYILGRAKNEQIVILNEAHTKPKHRVFTATLLEELYALGFRYFGAEAFNGLDMQELNKRKYPTYSSGFYTQEPQFGELTRKALKIGYTLFAYEGEGNGKDREINQARNIETVLLKDSEAKILIHCGHGHIREGEVSGSWGKAMAGRVLEFTGINPLTVDQTKYDSHYKKEHTIALLQSLDIQQATVFIDSNYLSVEGKENDKEVDIRVFHEPTIYMHERPAWLLSENKKWIKIDLTKVDLELPYFVFAFKNGENTRTAIPVDLVEVNRLKSEIFLALDTGKYKIVVQNKTNHALEAICEFYPD